MPWSHRHKVDGLHGQEDEASESQDIVANVIVAPGGELDMIDVMLRRGNRAIHHLDLGGIAMELRGDETLERIVQRVDPVHEEPEGWKALFRDHEAAKETQHLVHEANQHYTYTAPMKTL